ncbi:uncharacterized protein LOC142881336 isoform X2 [Nelusetta ayraudi]|uniref:uncharacterized protein LOC142881336 isoform X2 n=1 Tax=Nelusetta ayraudi TaxID=303726 RepID=UPI003F6FF272
MASLFKIPKKKRPDESDSSQTHMLSPLSRLQSLNQEPEASGYGNQSGRGRTGRMHVGNTLSSTANTQRDMVKTLLGIDSPSRRRPMAGHKAVGGSSNQSQPGKRSDSTSTVTNGWRPKRASDRLLQPAMSSETAPPSHKKKSDLSGLRPSTEHISLKALDSIALLRSEKRAATLSPSTRWAMAEGKGDRGDPSQKKSSSASGSDEDFVPPSGHSAHNSRSGKACPTPSALGSPPQSSRTADSTPTADDTREADRRRWREFRERRTPYRSAVLQLRQKKPKSTSVEPIVLSSEEEEEAEDDSDGGRVGVSRPVETQPPQDESGGDERSASFLLLPFASLHAGLTHVSANGEIMVTENEITIPVTGAEDGELSVVASQVRGYGIWDGALAQGGTLLAAGEGRAPSLLFLWVSEAQASLLRAELCAVRASAGTSGPPCCFLLLVLEEQLQELQAALLASILDMDEYRRGYRSSGSGPASPLEWSDGLLLLHTCPPPLDRHLLGLLGRPKEARTPGRNQQICKKPVVNVSGLQQLSTRLIQYPAPPCRGRITVTKEDLARLDSGVFLNDVIIDFYLKYVFLEGVGGAVAERSHVFSSFFYKQLSRRRVAGESDVASVPDRHTRHQRVRTWTRHVDVFTKDFLFVPVNQEAHWFLVVVCFPGLTDVKYEKFQRPSGGAVNPRSPPQQPECLQQAWQKDTVLKRPCVLVMDSLKLSYREDVCRLLRDYLQVEWEVRRGTPRLFTADTMRSSSCRVPQQDNCSDCGLYLLQYAESFLQNPVVNFDLPIRLEGWFPRQRVRQKREDIRRLILGLHQSQTEGQ